MPHPAYLLTAASALLTSSAVIADPIVRATPPETGPAPALFGGSAGPDALSPEPDAPTLSGIVVSHGSAPTGSAAEALDVVDAGGDVNLGEMAAMILASGQGAGPGLSAPGSTSSGALDLPQSAGHVDGASGAPSIPLPPAAGLAGAALVLIGGGSRRRGRSFRTLSV